MNKRRVFSAAITLAIAAGLPSAQAAEPLVQLYRGASASGDHLSAPRDLPAPPQAPGSASANLMLPSATGRHIPRDGAQDQTATIGAMRAVTVGAAQFAAQPKPLKAN